jgi:hypothetical protein
LAELASRQHGVAAAWQLRHRGIDRSFVHRRLRAQRIHRVHDGVFAVGHPLLGPQGWRMAAVLFGGPGAVLSHRAAGAEHQLRRWSGRPSITVPGDRRSTPAIDVHRARLPADEITTCDGIPITSVPRTLLDLATVLDDHALLMAVNEAEKGELGDALSLPDMLERHRGERGAGFLRRVLADAGYGVAIEDLEDLFARRIAAWGLPRPELNATISVDGTNYSPDCLWRDRRLIVELDSVRHHGTAPALTRDATRERRLVLAGWRIIHVTWAQLNSPRESRELERDLRAALGCDP